MLTKTVGSNTTSYAWDFENRLTSVTLPSSGGTVTFKYDPIGRRIEKSSSAATSVFAYDGDNPIEETNSSGAVVARYTQPENIDEPLAMLRSSTTSYYNADGLGSITSLMNGAGALAQTYGYDSFGKQTSSSGSLTNPFQYTGREFDPETGLYYYRARYYDQTVGRFLGEDPIGFFGGTADFYAYVHNDPVNLIDPLGFRATKAATADCIASALKALFPGVHASVGAATKNIGGHWNFSVQLQFPSYAEADAFYSVYAASANGGFKPPSRFGPGPALHLENLNWTPPAADGSYTGLGTAHIDLYNPNSSSLGGGGLGGLAGHVGIDGIVGHIVQAVGSNIDPANCPWGKSCTNGSQ